MKNQTEVARRPEKKTSEDEAAQRTENAEILIFLGTRIGDQVPRRGEHQPCYQMAAGSNEREAETLGEMLP